MATLFRSLWMLLLLSSAGVKGAEEKARVLELTDSSFDAAIAKHDHIFVDFYAPWCHHCKKLSPELDAAAPGLAGRVPPIILAKINAEKYSKVASKFDVSGYPTLKFFINGFPIDYRGPRKAAALSSHLVRLSSPDVLVLEDEAGLRSFLKKTDDSFPIFIGFGVQSMVVSELAKEYNNKAWFLVVDSFTEETMESYDFDKGPALIALRRGAGEQEIFYGPFEGEDLTQFVKQNLLPRVNLVTPESFRTLREDGRPIALAILDDDSSEQGQSFIRKLKAAAPANRGFVFAYVDTLKWPSFTDSFHIDTQRKAPVFIVWDSESSYFVSSDNYDYADERAEAHITFFLQEYKQGKAKRLDMKGPSFMGFLWSLVSMKSVYILILITGAIVVVQNMIRSDSANVQRRQLEHEEMNRGLNEHDSSSASDDKSTLGAPYSRNKED